MHIFKIFQLIVALNSLFCADVPLSNYSLTHPVGIPGNEGADRVAKAALSLPISPVKVSAMDFLPRAKLLMRKVWQEIWNCCDGNKLHAINPTVGVTKQNDLVGEMPSFLTGYRLVARVLHTHIFLVMTKHSVRHVILH